MVQRFKEEKKHTDALQDEFSVIQEQCAQIDAQIQIGNDLIKRKDSMNICVEPLNCLFLSLYFTIMSSHLNLYHYIHSQKLIFYLQSIN